MHATLPKMPLKAEEWKGEGGEIGMTVDGAGFSLTEAEVAGVNRATDLLSEFRDAVLQSERKTLAERFEALTTLAEQARDLLEG